MSGRPSQLWATLKHVVIHYQRMPGIIPLERRPRQLLAQEGDDLILYEYVETFLLPTDAHNVKKHRVINTF